MIPLHKGIQEPKISLEAFKETTLRILHYLPNVLSHHQDKNSYRIYSSVIAGTTKYVRPINQNLFIFTPSEFERQFSKFKQIIEKIKSGNKDWDPTDKKLIDSILYTIQQSVGAGADLLINPNSARKHVGNRFEELIRCVFSEVGISNKRIVLQIPYHTNEGKKIYKCENDLILSPFDKVKSSFEQLNEDEIVISVKTTSKDRMGKMFIDKILLERFVKHKQKFIGIFLNDVQRKGMNNISYTLVSGLFMVYSKFLTELDGIYYLDPPPKTKLEPLNRYIKPFSELLTHDLKRLLPS